MCSACRGQGVFLEFYTADRYAEYATCTECWGLGEVDSWGR